MPLVPLENKSLGWLTFFVYVDHIFKRLKAQLKLNGMISKFKNVLILPYKTTKHSTQKYRQRKMYSVVLISFFTPAISGSRLHFPSS